MSEKLWYLKRCDLFERLSHKELEQVESQCRVRSYPQNSPIDLPERRGDTFLLATGRVNIVRSERDGSSFALTSLGPGEIFGELADFHRAAANEYVETLAPTTLVMIPSDVMQQLVEAYPTVLLRRADLFGLRRQRIQRRLNELVFRSSRDRLAPWLLELAQRASERVRDGVRIRGMWSHGKLACAIGGTRGAVANALAELQDEGLISVDGRKLTLRQPGRLGAHAHAAIPKPRGMAPRRSTASRGN